MAGIWCFPVEIAEPLTLARLEAVARGAAPRQLDGAARERIRAARAVVEDAVARGEAVYGVTTGIGELASVRIAPADAERLQLNLLRSHAVGAGEPLPEEVVRGMMLLLAASLSRGHSGVRAELVELVLALLERGVVPVVPSRGSVGSSGDLAPLAHLGLVLVGEGEATFDGERQSGAEALRAAGLEPLRLTAKEGLALINGTHLMAAVGALATNDAGRVLSAATLACALSLEAFKGSTVPFDARLQEVRPQPGQARVAERLRDLLEGSDVVASHADCGRVQDPYTLRCAPQVIGAVADALDYVRGAVERELSAVTDNPLVFPEDGDVVNGGNFHGQPLSLPLDHLALALTELASYSERRTYALLSPSYAELPLPVADPRPRHGPDDRAVRRGRPGQRVPGARPPRGGRLDPHVRGAGGLQLDGRLGRAEGSHRGRARHAGGRDGARLRLPGPGVPPAAANDTAAGGRRGPRP